jgi:ubiquinone/menaquinone biosynthesis C-methylase UbiE
MAYRHQVPHDWHSQSYVDDWIANDVTKDGERGPAMRKALLAALPQDGSLRVLDVGGGYGVVSAEVLGAFPNATVTLQDYSEQMIGSARKRLATYSKRIAYVRCDLTTTTWPAEVGGPFDLVVTALALHNLRDMNVITACYRAIYGLLAPNGLFMDWDRFAVAAPSDAHVAALRDIGFQRIVFSPEDPLACITAYKV